MNPAGEDADDLVRKKIDLDLIANMSQQMTVPDSIIMGPSRSAGTAFTSDVSSSFPVRMEVPDRIRPGMIVSLLERIERRTVSLV
jgi:hypothetical protein